MRFWWVNQGHSFEEEMLGGFVWAPLSGAGSVLSQSRYYWDFVADVRSEDTIACYTAGVVRALASATGPAHRATRPRQLPDSRWIDEGHLAHVRYSLASLPVYLQEIPLEWRLAAGARGPFNKLGLVKQG